MREHAARAPVIILLMTPQEIETESQKAIERWRADPDDQEAFRALYGLHRNAVLAFVARKLGLAQHDDDVEEVAQLSWVDVHDQLPTYAPRAGARFRTWLLGIVKHKCGDYRRAHEKKAQKTRRPLEDAQDVAPEAGEDTFDPLDVPELREELRAVIATLPPDQQEVLRMRAEKLTFEQMKERTGEPLGTLKTRFYWALKKLKPIFERFRGED